MGAMAPYLEKEDVTVLDAMKKIDENAKGILYIVDDGGILTGSLTDGDIRRYIIHGGDLREKISGMLFRKTKFLYGEDRERAEAFMEDERINSVPIVDRCRKVVDVLFLERRTRAGAQSSQALAKVPVIVMAGGKGTRLQPYTKILPKPLIPVGDVPILERILDRFYRNGSRHFYITVNYKKGMIKSYFAEQEKPYEITFVEEDKPLGTAGSIRLVEVDFTGPVIVTNCDILIDAEYGKVVEFHKASGNDMTIVSSLKNISIPYGVLHAGEEGVIMSMEEKPQLSYFVNTGMYVVEPKFFERIPPNEVFHMTDLAELMIREGGRVGMYPIGENAFLDMGEFEEMKKMEERIEAGKVD